MADEMKIRLLPPDRRKACLGRAQLTSRSKQRTDCYSGVIAGYVVDLENTGICDIL